MKPADCVLVCAVINNASAISITKTLDTPMKKYDLMHQINNRGTFMTSKVSSSLKIARKVCWWVYLPTQLAIPHLLKSKRPHILTLSPPLNLDPRWVGMATAYTAAKYGMRFVGCVCLRRKPFQWTVCFVCSLSVLGMSEEFRGKIAVNALWPRCKRLQYHLFLSLTSNCWFVWLRTGIATAAIKMLTGNAGMMACRTPEIMSDAAHWILHQVQAAPPDWLVCFLTMPVAP
jgi:citronellol/citronellal dehydrogenase